MDVGVKEVDKNRFVIIISAFNQKLLGVVKSFSLFDKILDSHFNITYYVCEKITIS